MAVKKVRKSGVAGTGAVRSGTAVKEDIMSAKKVKKTPPMDIQGLVSEAASIPAPKAAKAPAAKPVAAAPKTVELFVAIDYPTEGEIISGLAYVMRIGTPGTGTVEVMINDGKWTPCRHSAGYWWFDWGYYKAGPHTITARLVGQDGKVLKKSAVRKCTVV